MGSTLCGFGSGCGQQAIELGGSDGPAAVIHGGREHACLDAEGWVVEAVNFLIEGEADPADAFQVEKHPESISGTEWVFIVDLDAGDDKDNSAAGQFGEVETTILKKGVTGVFQIMLVVGIIDDPLNIALVIANGQVDVENGIFHMNIRQAA